MRHHRHPLRNQLSIILTLTPSPSLSLIDEENVRQSIRNRFIERSDDLISLVVCLLN